MENLEKRTAEVITQLRPELASATVESEFERRQDWAERFGEAGRRHCIEDAEFHLSHMAEAITWSNPSLFEDYVAWAKVMLAQRNIPAADLETHLRILRDTVAGRLEEPMSSVVRRYVDSALDRLPAMPEETPDFLDPEAPLAELAGAYFDALSRADRQTASRLILDAVTDGVSVRDLYRHVFEPCLREVGRLWQVNRISVSQEHFFTAATQLIISQLYPHIFGGEKRQVSAVVTSVSGELHEIGARMVADYLEMEGWHSFYLGANSPAGSVVQMLAERNARLLGISVTMTFHLPAARALVEAVRSSREGRDVLIMVGGSAFNRDRDLWRKIGADGYAHSADEAVLASERLLASGGDHG